MLNGLKNANWGWDWKAYGIGVGAGIVGTLIYDKATHKDYEVEVTNLDSKFTAELEKARASLDHTDVKVIDQQVGLFEKFLSNAPDELASGVTALLTSILAARNSKFGLSNAFDPNTANHVINEANGQLASLVDQTPNPIVKSVGEAALRKFIGVMKKDPAQTVANQ